MCAKTTLTQTHVAPTPEQARLADMVTRYVTYLMQRQATTTLAGARAYSSSSGGHDDGGDKSSSSSDSDDVSCSDCTSSDEHDATAPQRRRRRTRRHVPPANEQLPSFDHFCAEYVPEISVAQYAHRLVTYMHCSSEAYVYALAYLRRLLQRGFPLHAHTIHRLMLTAIVVASKTRDDHCRSARYYAQVGGVTNTDLNAMELRFLSDLIDFRAEVLPREYHTVLRSVLARSSGGGRGGGVAAATCSRRRSDGAGACSARSVCSSSSGSSSDGAVTTSSSSVLGVSAEYASQTKDKRAVGDAGSGGADAGRSQDHDAYANTSPLSSSSSSSSLHTTLHACAVAARTLAHDCGVVTWTSEGDAGSTGAATALARGRCGACRHCCCAAAAAECDARQRCACSV